MLGLVGGMDYISTADYYMRICAEYRKRVGRPWRSPKVLIYSLDFSEVYRLQELGDWGGLAELIADAAATLERAGASVLAICSNTAHKVVGAVRSRLGVPLVSIVEAVGERVMADGVKRVGLLGTRFTMGESFYRYSLLELGLEEVLLPLPEDAAWVSNLIYEDLVRGVVRDEAVSRFKSVLDEMASRGAEGFVLGCGELPMLVRNRSEFVGYRLYNSLAIHVSAIVDKVQELEKA